MSKVLVSVASKGREDYNKAQLNLINSAVKSSHWQQHWHWNFLIRSVDGYVDEYKGVKIELGSWPVTEKYGVSWQHADMPYQFKPFAVQEALERGYRQILWCDSTIRIFKNPEPLWDKCKEHGILAWNNEGHPLKDWISDYAIGWAGVDVTDMKQIMACCIMFDFDHPKTRIVFDEWIEGAVNNCFYFDESTNPDYKGSRHDQALLSALMQKHGIEIQPYGELAYPHYTPIDPYFVNWGVKD